MRPRCCVSPGVRVRWSRCTSESLRRPCASGQAGRCCNLSPWGTSLCPSVRLNIRSPPFEPTVSAHAHYKLNHGQRDRITRSGYVCGCTSGVVSYNQFSPLIGHNEAAVEQSQPKKQRKECCARSSTYRRKAQKIVKLLVVEQSLKPIRSVPTNFSCGGLRAGIRSMFPPELTPTQELSIKTSVKAEVQPCPFCENLQKEKLVEFEKARLSQVEVDPDHLDRFTRAFASNVPDGWNTKKTPYVPNGNSTLFASRREGGNWVDQPFSPECDVKLIYSSGKPRVVTLYSEYNVRVLTPLHHSLFSFLRRRNWLLVGSPTDERLRYMADGCVGPEWLSFDYESATDNIKIAYVQRAIEVLIDKGDGLSADEIRCLRVVSSLMLGPEDAKTGQPMGSPMSFPLLCLVNKTVVDLALASLLDQGEIQFNEWTGHRCLINGDDLLTKSTSRGDLVAAIGEQGSKVGLRVNKEKTMRSAEWAEINSTPFRNGILQKKTNVSAMWMAGDVPDVIGFAHESTSSVSGFRMVLLANTSRLARQKIKTLTRLPFARVEVCMSNRRLKKALLSRPSSFVPEPRNVIGVETMPDGFELSRDEIAEAVTSEVARVKKYRFWKPLFDEARVLRGKRRAVFAIPPERRRGRVPLSILKPKRPIREPVVLTCLARYWENKIKERVLAEEAHSVPDLIVSDLSGIDRLVDSIRYWKENGGRPKEPPPLLGGAPFGEFVSLSDD